MADHVERAVAAWALRRPDWELEGMAVFGRISRLERTLELARSELLNEYDLSTTDVDVLAALWRHGDGLRPRDLRTEMMIGSGTLTPRLDRLERRELLVRLPDPDDQRGVVLRLTKSGRALVPEVVGRLLERENSMLAGLDPDRRRRLAEDLACILQDID